MAESNRTFRHRVDPLKAFRDPPPNLDFALPGMLAGTVGALVSPGGHGKSIFALEMACTIAGGPDMLELGELPRGRVLYLCAEDPRGVIHLRLHELGKLMTSEQQMAVAKNLDPFALVGTGLDLARIAAHQRRLTAQARGRRMVILDTLRRVQSLDENSSGEMAQFLGVLERVAGETGATVLYLHHTTKGAAIAGTLDTQQASRGSSVLVDNARWQAYLIGMTRDDAKAYSIEDDRRHWYVRFGIAKQNYGPPWGEKWYERGPGGVLRPATLERKARKGRKDEVQL